MLITDHRFLVILIIKIQLSIVNLNNCKSSHSLCTVHFFVLFQLSLSSLSLNSSLVHVKIVFLLGYSGLIEDLITIKCCFFTSLDTSFYGLMDVNWWTEEVRRTVKCFLV